MSIDAQFLDPIDCANRTLPFYILLSVKALNTLQNTGIVVQKHAVWKTPRVCPGGMKC